MNKMLKPTISMDKPNDPIEIHNGIAIIKYKGYGIETEVHIYQSWFPYDQVKFQFTLNSMPVHWLGLIKGGLNERLEIHIRDYSPWPGIIIGIKDDDKGLAIKGIINNPVLTNTEATNIKVVDFILFNFRTYAGTKIETAPKSYRTGELKFENPDHSLIIHSIKQEGVQKEEQSVSGGYILTSSCRIEFKNECSLERVSYLLKRLGIFLSFLNGRRTYPRYIKAYTSDLKQIWTDFTPYSVSQYKPVISWMPHLIDKEMAGLWSSFLSFTEEEDDFEKVELIIHWYLEALNSSGFTKGSIILLQTSYEMLYSWLVDEKKMITPNSEGFKGAASTKMRTLLDFYDLNRDLPGSLSALIDGVKLLSKKGEEKDPSRDFSFWYTETRNIFTHFSIEYSKNRKMLPDLFDWRLLNIALFNLEFILLKMLNYNGTLKSRLKVVEREQTTLVHMSSPYQSLSQTNIRYRPPEP